MSVERAEVPVRFVEIGSWRLETLGDLAELRSGLHHTLTGAPLPPDRHLDAAPERIVLVASELATNALRHGMPPARLRLLSDGREFVVDVVDHSPDDPPVIGGHRPPGAGGFGLLLARRAAREVAWFTTSTGEKHVWARFEIPEFRGTAGARSSLALLT